MNREGNSSTGFHLKDEGRMMNAERNQSLVALVAAKSFLRADCYVQTLCPGQRTLKAIGSQERFTFEFARQRHVKQVEGAAAKPLGVRFGKRSSAHQSFIAISRGFDQPATFEPTLNSSQCRVALAGDAGAPAASAGAPNMKGAMTNGVGNFERVQRKKE
jgi:hypothetical protein